MNEIIIICGPTAVGKTEISIQLAKKLETDIISSDSMQIYKTMDIGTAKADKDEMQGVTHHMIDIVDACEEFNVSDYQREAGIIIEKLFLQNKIPIIAGGTGLYINSLIYNMDFNDTAKDKKIRKKYQEIYERYGADYLYDLLLKKDRVQAESIEKNNVKRIVRALEVLENKSKMKAFNKINDLKNYKINMYVLELDRKILYERINRRVDKMIENGLIDEVKALLDKGLKEETQSMKAIGYRQIISYLKGETDKVSAIELIKRDSRRYAKRQYTWFRRYNFAKWIDVEKNTVSDIVKYITDDIK